MKQANGFDPIEYAFTVLTERVEKYNEGSSLWKAGEIRAMAHMLALCCHNNDSTRDAVIENKAKVIRDEFRALDNEQPHVS